MDLKHMENGMGGGGGGGGTVGNTGTLSEIDFQRLAQTIATSIQKIVQNVSTMQRMVNQCNTPQDSPELKKQLHQIMTYTNQVVSDTSNQLDEVEKCRERHLKIQRDRLVDEFTTAITAFQAVQRKTLDIKISQVHQAKANQYNIPKPPGSSNNTTNNGGNNSFFDDNIFGKKSQQQQQQQQQMQVQEEIDLQALEEQEKVIRELENNIVGVNEIYKKLGAMVYEQGLTVDSIESSVEQTSVFVSQAADNLRKASSYKNKIRKKKLILFSILTVVAVLILIVMIMQLRN
uniref:t-SNARE coiled-coil homology domain-containing protein n=1 Tax=Glossina austeni TaxID=7395 RepID=A0A1A9UJA1_GLOAU